MISFTHAQLIIGDGKLDEKQVIVINGDTVIPAKVIKSHRTSTIQNTHFIDIENLPTELSNAKTFGKALSSYSLTKQCNSVETGNEAAFKLLFVSYNSYPIPIETKASWMPADPGINSNSTILGIDSDKDCVRDDIERYIGKKYPRKDQIRHRKYLYEYAKWLGIFIKGNPWSVATARSISQNIGKAAKCVRRTHGAKGMTSKLLDDIFAEFHNSFPRSFRYIKNRGALSGWAPREKLSVSCP